MKPLLLPLSLAILLISAATLSSYLAGPVPGSSVTSSPDPSLTEAKLAAEASPGNSSLQLTYARALVTEAERTHSAQPLFTAVEKLTAILEETPDNTDAILELATITAQAGVLDKAIRYYEQYLKLMPENKKVRTDYALALLQNGAAEVAKNELTAILKTDQQLFPPRMALAITERALGNTEQARIEGEKALLVVPDKEGEEIVKGFLAGLRATPSSGSSATPTSTSKLESLEDRVRSFLSAHTVIGPKLTDVSCDPSNSCTARLKGFPVEAMPPFVRSQLETKLRSLIQPPPGTTTQTASLKLEDSESGGELISVVYP